MSLKTNPLSAALAALGIGARRADAVLPHVPPLAAAHPRRNTPSLAKALFAVACAAPFAHEAMAHGYVSAPASRAYLCSTHVNTDCGAIQWEPQSTEAPKGFPAAGPADGHIASANGAFPEMDQQSAGRWSKVGLQAGANTFTWTLTARHATTNWRYYITKPGWNPNAPLTRDSFDLVPFCTVDGGGVQPPASVSHQCNVPARQGYQIILAVWEIADTGNAFYHVIDADFGGTTPTPTPT
ncbi:lytic polysaccharide monooxygenase, partial [Frateuria sp. Soil773]|uniref:lytic polysaccharide monooxygenase n=1 Tax=Frateuria sp. Soil773 TaxID=1736407 RepID=UPI001910B3C4